MATLLRRPSVLPHLPSQVRALSTTLPRCASLQWQSNSPESLAAIVPAYPYGSPQWYKQSRSGLYGGQQIQFGNNVSGRFETKTRRKWRPNIRAKKLYSRALGRTVQVRVSTRVLKTIDKLGGLDEYLLGEKEARIRELGESGWWLRWAVMQTGAVRERFRREREVLGLPASDDTEGAVIEIDAEEALATAAEDAIEELAQDDVETEAVATDDAFQIESSPELPPLRFRVGPRQHIMLTPTGWRRSLPARTDPKSSPSYIRRLRNSTQATVPMEVLNASLAAATVEESVPVPPRIVDVEDREAEEEAEALEDVEGQSQAFKVITRKLTLQERVRVRKEALSEIVRDQMSAVEEQKIVARRMFLEQRREWQAREAQARSDAEDSVIA
ncbi:hypothetical protein B0A48_06445 [Cryoendolithus antarcticus]|uniref:Large ribosomal subunit protein bL28m n=1 Tax=Cryoendolithus antarcticus TaxID=1507870 RepID=A0A1V8TB24_9PEZI|nr:hypothetical protein B0A48_06445 [Cryoendolithus antarcticus]